jgi:hypothetical protein
VFTSTGNLIEQSFQSRLTDQDQTFAIPDNDVFIDQFKPVCEAALLSTIMQQFNN